jgi:hypothetical protein
MKETLKPGIKLEHRFTVPSSKTVPTTKLQVSAARKRYRLGSARKQHVDGEWLSLDCGPLTSQSQRFQKLALKINGLVLDEAEQWWQAQRGGTVIHV